MSDYERKTDRTGLDQRTPPDKDPDRVHCDDRLIGHAGRTQQLEPNVGSSTQHAKPRGRMRGLDVMLSMMMRLALRASLFD
jgi:hypothetical protein